MQIFFSLMASKLGLFWGWLKKQPQQRTNSDVIKFQIKKAYDLPWLFSRDSAMTVSSMMVISRQAHLERNAGHRRQGQHLHFRVTGESNESRNNPLSYQSLIHPLHQQLIGQHRGYSQVVHESKQCAMGRIKEQREKKRKHKSKTKIRSKANTATGVLTKAERA